MFKLPKQELMKRTKNLKKVYGGRVRVFFSTIYNWFSVSVLNLCPVVILYEKVLKLAVNRFVVLAEENERLYCQGL